MNILTKADEIVNQDTERRKMYGTYAQCNKRIADIMSVLTNKEITTEDVFKLELAMKLSREINCHKEENLLDSVAYIAALNDYLNNTNK